MTRRREFVACVALVVVSLLVGLAVLELACRLANEAHRLLKGPNLTDRPVDWIIHDPLLGLVFKPNGVSPEGSFDSDGFRVTSGARALNAGLVVASGDSFTFGMEVANNETWPAILQEIIGVRVINAGVSAYGIDQTVLRTERLAAALAPTAMVVSFIADNIWRSEMRRLWGAEKPYFTLDNNGELVLHNVPVPSVAPNTRDGPGKASLLQRLLNESALVEIVMRRLQAFGDGSHRYFERFGDTVRAVPSGTGEKVSCALMRRLAQAGVPVLVVAQYQPTSWTRGPAYLAEQRRQNRVVLGCASTAGLVTLDTFETLNEVIARGGLQSLYLQQHHSALGNRLVAQAIGDAMAAGRMLEPPVRR